MNEQQFNELLKKLKIPTNNRSYADIFDLLDAKLSEYLDRQDAASQEMVDEIQDALDYAEIKKNEVGSGIALKRGEESKAEEGTDFSELRDASEKALRAQAQVDDANAHTASEQQSKSQGIAGQQAGKLWFSSNTGADNINTMFFQALDDLKYGEFDHALSIFEAILQVEPNNASAYIGKVLVTYKLKEIREIGSSYDKDIFTDINMRRAYDHGSEQQKKYLDDAKKEVQSGKRYKEADRKAQDVNDAAAQEEAIKLFAALGNYRDSRQRREKCEECLNEIKYQKAVTANKKSFSSADYHRAAALYREVSGYKNADNLAEECEAIAKRKEGEEAEKKRADSIQAQFLGLKTQFEAIANPILAEYRDGIKKATIITTVFKTDEMQKRADALKEYASKNMEVYHLANAKEVISEVEATMAEIGKLSKTYENIVKEKKSEKRSDILVCLCVLLLVLFVGMPAPNGTTTGVLTLMPVRNTHDYLYVKNGTSVALTSYNKFYELVLDGSAFIYHINCPRAEISEMTLRDGRYTNLKIPDTVTKLTLDEVSGCNIPESVEWLYITGECRNIEIPSTVKRVEIVNATLNKLTIPEGVEEVMMDTVTTYNTVGFPRSLQVADLNNLHFDYYYQ